MLRVIAWTAVCVWGIVGAAAAAEFQPGLSDRELAVQRWLSSITFLQDRNAEQWPVWVDDGKQFDLNSLRYQLAFAGYGCAALADKTPAYSQLVHRQLEDICLRMIQRRVWHFVTHYWKYGDDPVDPCRFDNVMYTGHLAQLMGLFELLTGDDRFRTQGWDFVDADGRCVHYDLGKAVQVMHQHSVAHPSGGICCEPGLIFAVCNNHSATSFVLHDLLCGTDYAQANQRWFDWMKANFRNRVPLTNELLYVVYREEKQVFIPVGDIGADGWALGFGRPWYPDPAFAEEGWEHVRRRGHWVKGKNGDLHATNNPLMRLSGEVTVGSGNSFLAILAAQMEGQQGETTQGLFRWFDGNYGREVDTDEDGHSDSYYYDAGDGRHIAITGNLATALATDGDSLRNLYQTRRDERYKAPRLAEVDYPNVLVRAAEYQEPTLRFSVLPGNGKGGATTLRCAGITGPVKVERDGAAYADYTLRGGELVIRTDLNGEQTFTVTSTR